MSELDELHMQYSKKLDELERMCVGCNKEDCDLDMFAECFDEIAEV